MALELRCFFLNHKGPAKGGEGDTKMLVHNRLSWHSKKSELSEEQHFQTSFLCARWLGKALKLQCLHFPCTWTLGAQEQFCHTICYACRQALWRIFWMFMMDVLGLLSTTAWFSLQSAQFWSMLWSSLGWGGDEWCHRALAQPHYVPCFWNTSILEGHLPHHHLRQMLLYNTP